MNIFIAALGITALFFTLFFYLRARKMILQAEQAIFPAGKVRMHTDRGEVQPLHFHSGDWRTKKIMTIVSILLIAAVFIILLFFEPASPLALINFAFILPMMNLINTKLPSFFITADGMYLNETFTPWEKVHAYSISYVVLGDEMYGMFEDSSEFKKVQFLTGDKAAKKQSIYIHETENMDTLLLTLSSQHVEQIPPEQQHHHFTEPGEQ